MCLVKGVEFTFTNEVLKYFKNILKKVLHFIKACGIVIKCSRKAHLWTASSVGRAPDS